MYSVVCHDKYRLSMPYIYIYIYTYIYISSPVTGPEGSRKLRFPDFVTTAQDGDRLSALRTGCLYPQEILLIPFLLEAESAPGP